MLLRLSSLNNLFLILGTVCNILEKLDINGQPVSMDFYSLFHLMMSDFSLYRFEIAVRN